MMSITQTLSLVTSTLLQSIQTFVNNGTFKQKRHKTFEHNTLKNIAFYEAKIIDTLKPHQNIMNEYLLHTCESVMSNAEKYFKIQLFIDRFRSDLNKIDYQCFNDISNDLQNISIPNTTTDDDGEPPESEFVRENSDDEKTTAVTDHNDPDEMFGNDADEMFDQRIDFSQNTITKAGTYNRLLHFTDYLKKIQGKKQCVLSENALETIKNDIKKYRLTGKVLTKKHMMDILQRHKFTTLYDFIPYILNVFNQSNTLDLGNDTEMYLISTFKNLQDIFSIVCPKSRKSFINYKYTIFKLLELRPSPTNDAFCENMKPLLKSREKITKLDVIWKKMCESLGWKFIQTL